jgi:hypothetical protein
VNKRLAAGFAAATMTASVFGVATSAPASAAPTPCATYPAGQQFNFTATPTDVTVKRNTNVVLNAVLSRGEAKTPCEGYLTALYYTFQPHGIQQSKRTNARGVAPYIARIRSSRNYFFVLYYGDIVKRSAQVGSIHVTD